MERFSFIFLVAGIGFFLLAFFVSALVPMVPVKDLQTATLKELASRVPLDFIELREEYPDAFKKAFGDKNDEEALAEALTVGHRAYIAEACWHCHSQQVRHWGNDEARFGRVSYPEEYQNVLNKPPLWGTRRIGPDLAREAGRQSNDWHVAHFWNPPDVVPDSVMPSYPWFYEDDGLTPNKTGLSVIAYVQWLGSWNRQHNVNIYTMPAIESDYASPVEGQMPPASQTPSEEPTQDDAYDDNGGDDY